MPGQAAAVEFAHDVAQFWDRQLGQRLFGIYLIGSLAHGGFSARYSDIDMALIAEGRLRPGEIYLVNRKAAKRSATFSSRLSLFWANQYFSAGRFPPLDRVDYIDHAVAILERRRVRPARPTLTEIRTYLRAEPFRKWSQEVHFFSSLSRLKIGDHKRYLRALLYPARFCIVGRPAQLDRSRVTSVAWRNNLQILDGLLTCCRGEKSTPVIPARFWN